MNNDERTYDKEGNETTWDAAIMVKCTGEAHRNPFIDNCGICFPFWEEYPTCPKDGRKLTVSEKYWCRTCHRHYQLVKGAASVH